MNSNGTHDDSFNERYSLVGYNISPPTKPVNRDKKLGWYDMHEKHNSQLAEDIRPNIILCGDSIMAGLQRFPHVWNKYFKHRGAVNCSIGGDQTQHVLWRMKHISLPSTVQYVVVHCGTNNIGWHSPQNIANGVISIGLVLQDKNRKLHVVVTGLIPRDYSHSSYRRQKIRDVNRHLKQHCEEYENVTYMRQDDDWILSDGGLNKELYWEDGLHLSEAGNEKFSLAITEVIQKLEEGRQCEHRVPRYVPAIGGKCYSFEIRLD